MITIEPTEYKTATTPSKQRICSFNGTNELGGIPSITFNEEMVTHDTILDRVYHTPVGSCATALIDPAKVLTLRSPIDDSVIGSATYMDVLVTMYSLGRQTQIERDEALAAAKLAAEVV